MDDDQSHEAFPRNTFLLAFSSLFADVSTEMLYPVLPVFLTQMLGATGSIVGLIRRLRTGYPEHRLRFLRRVIGQAATP